jgi:hypothetical protein
MNEKRNRKPRRQHIARRPRTHHPMHCAPAPIIRQPLQQIRNVDQHRARHGHRSFEVSRVKWIDFQPTDTVLEEEGAQSEISVWDNARVTFLLDDGFGDGGIVQEPELGVCALGDVVKKGVAEIHGHCQTFEDGEAEGVALGVEGVDGGAEVGELGFCGTGGVGEASVFVAFWGGG